MPADPEPRPDSSAPAGWQPPPHAAYACDPGASRGRLHDEAESRRRSPFQRDRDRIIHSAAFRKLKGKTQVFVDPRDDYARTRLSHSLEVAQITRALARALGLDEDLAEAIALSHDLGHTPFGHTGEDALAACMEGHGGFAHNDQTLRILTELEHKYPAFPGLNLTWETLEGVVKHNGPVLPLAPGEALPTTLAALAPHFDLALDRHASAEAQAAAISDDIAYHNHDMHDGLRAGFFDLADLADLPLVGDNLRAIAREHPGLDPQMTMNELVRRNIGAMVEDILIRSRETLAALAPDGPEAVRAAGGPVIGFSAEMEEIDRAVRTFLWTRMYRHYKIRRQRSKGWRVVQGLFEIFMAEPDTLPAGWARGYHALPEADSEARARFIADYIAGMTDRYACLEYRRLHDLTDYEL